MKTTLATAAQVRAMIAETKPHPARFDAYEVSPVVETFTGHGTEIEAFAAIAEARQAANAANEVLEGKATILWTLYGVRSGIAEAIADRDTEAEAFALLRSLTGIEGVTGQTRYNVAEPVAIVTVSGGVADIATNPGGYPIEIIDYDNLRESIKDRQEIILSDQARAYIRNTDSDFWYRCKPLLDITF